MNYTLHCRVVDDDDQTVLEQRWPIECSEPTTLRQRYQRLLYELSLTMAVIARKLVRALGATEEEIERWNEQLSR